MKYCKKFAYFLAALILIQLLFLSFTPNVKANLENHTQYYQELDLNNTYLYNVIQFNGPIQWYNISWGFEGEAGTNQGGQIKVNFTGNYNKHPFDTSIFSNPIPWMDIEILERNFDILETNFTLSNISNSEVAINLMLGYNNFQSGFLIPVENLTDVKEKAMVESSGLSTGKVAIEETNNFLYIEYDQDGEGQRTSLVYERWTGLLVWAKTSLAGYLLEIQSLNFTLNYDRTYNYDVILFNGPIQWYNMSWGFEGDASTNQGGQININFTGDYDKHPFDTSVFNNPIPWIDIEIIKNNSGILETNFTLSNRSNSEAAMALTLGYNNFQSGFLIPIMHNLTRVKQLAFQEAEGFVSGLVNIEESDLTIKIIFMQDGGGQETSLIYEKWTGLLLWTKTSIGNYLLEMVIDGYTPWEFKTESPQTTNFLLDFLPYLIIISISFISAIATLTASKLNKKVKEFNKYILIAIIAIASFTSFFVFSSNLEISEVNKPQREVADITLIVDFGNGTIKIIENFDLTDYNTTAFDALITWCEVNYHDYGDMGILVEEIDGVKGNWRYSINGDFPGVSCNKYNLRDGDTVKWIYG